MLKDDRIMLDIVLKRVMMNIILMLRNYNDLIPEVLKHSICKR